MVTLRVENLRKVFGGTVRAVDGVTFEVPNGCLFTMLGPSGCGKTTTLRLIAGLESPTEGRILFDGEDYTRFPPYRRGIGMVFQSYALFPHMTVFDNVAYGLRIRKLAPQEVRRRVKEALALVELPHVQARRPAELSGGQQQRIALARALVYRPKLLLLDEPLSNLDAKLRVHMREEIRAIQRRAGITTIYVTHDQEEALSISDLIAVLHEGKVSQLGPPFDIYENPQSVLVADFIGKANFLACRHVAAREQGGAIVQVQDSVLAAGRVLAGPWTPGDPGLLYFRPERARLYSEPGEGRLRGTVTDLLYLGETVRYTLELPGGETVLISANRRLPGLEAGQAAYLEVGSEDLSLMPQEDLHCIRRQRGDGSEGAAEPAALAG